uniref:Uncharacterized protein n=1 Tax=Rhizophora mucronata TaxID=61149 RepID=A0A2P2MMH5_RHIMU
MSTQQQQRKVIVRDLVEEGKKRIVFLGICVIGLSYLMSLTSSSVLVNLPAAATLIILIRYFSLDYEMRRKAATYKKSALADTLYKSKPLGDTMIVEKSDWRRKVNSPVVEDAIDQFTRHIVSEWVTDLWYCRLTPDREGPEELMQIINGVIGETSSRMRNINLIDLLTRDLVSIFCSHLELFRATQVKIEKQQSGPLTIEQRDKELRHVLAAESKLHPALFSAQAEHKVLQHLMDGLISFTFRPEDLQCSFFRYVARELLACAVMRPVLNLASPRFINERIEKFIMSRANKGIAAARELSQSKSNGSPRISSDNFSRLLDPSVTGVELVQLKNDQSKSEAARHEKENVDREYMSKDPLLSIDTRSSHSWSSLPLNSQVCHEGGIQRHRSGGEWGDMLDMMSLRRTAALAPENFENMWTKGRDYRKKEGENRLIEQVPQHTSVSKVAAVNQSKKTSRANERDGITKVDPLGKNGLSVVAVHSAAEHRAISNLSLFKSDQEYNQQSIMHVDEGESGGSSSYTSEEEDPSSVTGLDSPGTKVWDGKTKRNLAVSKIHHPLENSEGHMGKRIGRGHARYQRLPRSQFGRKRSRLSTQKVHVWHEIERTSFLSGDGQDILNSKEHSKADDSSSDSEIESMYSGHSGATATSSALASIPESHSWTVNSLKSSMMVDSFFKLRCEVLGANIVRSGSKTFAVYSISVTDVNNNSWSIKRRFRHFEELHRRLKEYSEYCLHLPPKHFLSTGLDLLVIQERCKLLDKYLKKLLQLPTISGSIEVWDFLSVDSQTYIFSNSFSIVETLSVDLDDNPSETGKRLSKFFGPAPETSPANTRKQLHSEEKESTMQSKQKALSNGLTLNTTHSPEKKLGKDFGNSCGNSVSNSDVQIKASPVKNLGKILEVREDDSVAQKSKSPHDDATEPSLPSEWVPPNLTAPMLDLIDVIFQLQDGGWIRRQAFWVVKQILQLGMGDALDDWLIEKIQLLRRGSVVASGIKRVEQILWPDGIFITKHPKRRPPISVNKSQSSPLSQQSTEKSTAVSSPHGQQPTEISSPRLSDEQQQEAARCAKFVYELMIDNAPAAIVGIVGRKEYEQCAKDLYFFLQSSVCVKQLAFDLLELLFVSSFPEMEDIFKQLHEDKAKFGEFKTS